MATKIYQHIRHGKGNDTNGNPRRAWVVYTLGRTMYGYAGIDHIYMEGYGDRPQALHAMQELPTVDVEAGFWRRMIKFGKDRKKITYL